MIADKDITSSSRIPLTVNVTLHPSSPLVMTIRHCVNAYQRTYTSDAIPIVLDRQHLNLLAIYGLLHLHSYKKSSAILVQSTNIIKANSRYIDSHIPFAINTGTAIRTIISRKYTCDLNRECVLTNEACYCTLRTLLCHFRT